MGFQGGGQKVDVQNICVQLLSNQNVEYGMVVDGFARLQALNFGYSELEISEDRCS